MSIEEQIQIVEDNLNEYGQCNITLEEYNFLKDELYSSGCLAGIELGRTDAIEEVKRKMISCHTDAIFRYGVDIVEARADAFDELKEWVKEQKK